MWRCRVSGGLVILMSGKRRTSDHDITGLRHLSPKTLYVIAYVNVSLLLSYCMYHVYQSVYRQRKCDGLNCAY